MTSGALADETAVAPAKRREVGASGKQCINGKHTQQSNTCGIGDRGEEDGGSYGDDDGGLAKKVRIGQCGCCGWDDHAKRRKGAIVNVMVQHRWEMGARRTMTMTRQRWEHTTISNTDGRVAMASTMVVVVLNTDDE